MKSFYERLSWNIQKRRKELHLTQEQLAEKIDKTPSFIGQIERGECLPKIDTFYDLVQCLGIDVQAVFYGDPADDQDETEQICNCVELMSNKDRWLVLQIVKIIHEHRIL